MTHWIKCGPNLPLYAHDKFSPLEVAKQSLKILGTRMPRSIYENPEDLGTNFIKNKFPESDPLGVPQHAPGAKLDAGKQLPFLVLGAFVPALKEVIKVGTFGANKYTKNGWLQVTEGKERYYEALLRHLLEDMQNADSKDPQTGITHLAHAAWNILAVITLRLLSK